MLCPLGSGADHNLVPVYLERMGMLVGEPLHIFQYLLKFRIARSDNGRLRQQIHERRQERNLVYTFFAEYSLGYHRHAASGGNSVCPSAAYTPGPNDTNRSSIGSIWRG